MTIYSFANLFVLGYLGLMFNFILALILSKVFSNDQEVFPEERIERKMDNVIELLEILPLYFLNLRFEKLFKELQSPGDNEENTDEG